MPEHAVTPIVGRVRQQRHRRCRNRQPVRRGVHLLLGQIQLAGTDVFIRVELDLLEADHARDHVHFAMRGGASGSGGDSLFRERIEDRDARVADRGGVVVAVDLADERLAPFEVEPLHLVQLSLDDIDRLRMQRRRAAGEVGFADHPRLARRVDDDEVVGGHRTQADRVGRVRLVGPRPEAVRRRVIEARRPGRSDAPAPVPRAIRESAGDRACRTPRSC